MKYAAYLFHEDDDISVFFLADSKEAAEAKAIAHMLVQVGQRDEDEFPTEQDWIDCCLSEGWLMDSGEVLP